MLGFLLGNGFYPDPVMRPNSGPMTDPFPDHQVTEMTRRLEALEMACAGLWHLLKHHHGYTDDQLVMAIQAVDEMDGVRDGKITPTAAVCPSCGRKLLTRARQRCAWCGTQLQTQPFSPNA